MSANQSVLVVDTTPPSVTAPRDKTIEAASQCLNVPHSELGLPAVSDLVDANPSVSSSPAGPYCLGETLITWTATDSSGNAANATQSLFVQDAAPPRVIDDTTPPVITALYDITVVSSMPARIPRSDYDAISVTDSQDPRPRLLYAPPVLSPGREHTVTWTATDWAGNNASATNTVHVTPDEKCESTTIKGNPYLRRNASIPHLFEGVRTVVNTGTLPISSIYMNATDWFVSPSGEIFPANLTMYRVGGGGHPSAWTSLNGVVVPPDPLKPHRSLVVQLQVNLTGYDFENKNMNQRVSYNPSCIGQGAGGASGQGAGGASGQGAGGASGQGAGGASGQGAGGASGQAPAPSIAHDSAGSPAVSTLIIAPGPVEN